VNDRGKDGPALSVVLATPDTFESVRLTMQHVQSQSVRQQIEVVIVGPVEQHIRPPAEAVSGLWGYQLVAAGAGMSVARANAAGIRRARAPVVALAEEHCFPEPGWAEALIAAHRGPWAVVGPAMRNANPGTIVSWCDFVIGYGPWMYPVKAGPAPFLPGHNSSYKKSILLEYGERLEGMMESETELHLDLGRRGYQLYLEPEARAAHTNFALMSSWLRALYYAGRVFAASRFRGRSVGKRMLYAAGSPLIPVVRLWRCLRELARPGRPHKLITRMLPVLCVGLAADGWGQLAGYLLGRGEAVERLAAYEFHRYQHVPDADRRTAEEQAPA
jgi:hypothetical protein